MLKRQQQQFEVNHCAVRVASAHAGDETNGFLGRSRDQFQHVGLFRLGPQRDELRAFQLPAKQCAAACACKAKAIGPLGILGEDEGIGECAPDPTGLDVSALWSDAMAPLFIPVFEHVVA